MVASVNRRALALSGLVLLSVAALSMSAATLGETTGGGPDVSPLPNPSPVNVSGQAANTSGNSSSATLYEDEGSSQTLTLAGCNDTLASLPGTVLYFGALAGILYVLKRRFSLGALIFGGYAIVPVALAAYFLRTDCISAGGGGGGGGGGLGQTLSQAPPGPEVPASVMIGVFALLFVGVAAAIFYSSGEGEYVSEDDDDEFGAEADVEDIAAAAADAAERLEKRNADVDNEVYRAWWEMTQLLDVSSPETYTPGEFADAAVEVGIDREHVDPLTTLFEEVRYGHRDAESREERAIEVFRTIEAEYGTDGSGSADDATDAESGADTSENGEDDA
jgi:hypothetical protein